MVSDKVKTTTDADKKNMYEKLLSALTIAVENLETAVHSGENNSIEQAQQYFINQCKDPLSVWLDSKLGSTVKNNAIFNSLPRYWEEEFHKDMDALNVRHFFRCKLYYFPVKLLFLRFFDPMFLQELVSIFLK